MNDHVKICNCDEIKHIWSGGVYEPPKNIKRSLAAFGIDVSKHDFLFPYLVVFDTKESLPETILQPTAKRVKTCNNVNGLPVECVLKFTSTHQLLSFSLCTNVPGCETDFVACREGDTSFNKMQHKYRNVIFSLDQAIAAENAYNASTGFKDSPILDIKILKKKFIAWLKKLPCVGFNSGSYDLNVLEKI